MILLFFTVDNELIRVTMLFCLADCMILLIFGNLCFTRYCSDIVGVVCIPMSSKFLTESTGEKNGENWSIFSEDMDKVR